MLATPDPDLRDSHGLQSLTPDSLPAGLPITWKVNVQSRKAQLHHRLCESDLTAR